MVLVVLAVCAALFVALLIFFYAMRHRRVSLRIAVSRFFRFELDMEEPGDGHTLPPGA